MIAHRGTVRDIIGIITMETVQTITRATVHRADATDVIVMDAMADVTEETDREEEKTLAVR